MAKLTEGHFHCKNCDELFEAPIRKPEDQLCPSCGKPPTGESPLSEKSVSGMPSVANLATGHSSNPVKSGETQDARKIREATINADGKNSDRIKRTKRREKRSSKLLIMLGVWVLLMGLTVGLVNYFNPDEDETGNKPELTEALKKRQLEAEMKQAQAVIQQAAPECEEVITSFLNATSAASKAQFVYQGVKLTTVMNRYYQSNPSFSSTRSQVKLIRGELLKNTKHQTIGTICVNQQKETFEVIFVRVGNEWKIDWEALVRYDDRSWSLFPASSDGSEGEFRLYMRVRDSNKEFDEGEISIVFYKPDMYVKGEFRSVPSPAVRLPVDSELGLKIREMVSREDDMKTDAYGFTTSLFDKPRYHRVRVKLRLKKEDKEETFELLEILADHWYGDGVTESDSEISTTEKNE
ncbi:hypothetical protein NT6N_05730 [Oceaniferula spumae]|uniref:Zinc ribbon domain-containing protein n=1 Tax=Oceaniferula spumae TaxID=2979115 RepID=A0AAT9FHW0_9BACT